MARSTFQILASSAVGGLTVDATKVAGPITCEAALAGAGSVAAIALLLADGDASMAGAGALTATANVISVSVALSGNILSALTETDLVGGGRIIVLTLTGDTWIAA